MRAAASLPLCLSDGSNDGHAANPLGLSKAMQHWLAAVGVLALLAAIPGPDVAVVSRYALLEGRKAGLRATAGVVGGLLAWAALVVVGLGALLAASGGVYDAVRLVGAAFLVMLGLRQLWFSRSSAESRATGVPRRSAWRAGLLTNLLNPKVAVIYTALLPTLVPRQQAGMLSLAMLALIHMALSFAVLTAYSHLFARFRKLLTRPKMRAWVERVTGTVLVAIGIRVAVQR